MSAFDGAKIAIPALRRVSSGVREQADRVRGLAEALGTMGLDEYAKRADGVASRLHGWSMRIETIAIVLASHADKEVSITQPIVVVPTCSWPWPRFAEIGEDRIP